MREQGPLHVRAHLAWWRRQIGEIAADPVLRGYGAILAATHVLTFLFWTIELPMESLLGRRGIAICWPFFERCGDWRLLGPGAIRLVLWIYLGAGVAAVGLFARRRWTGAAWIGLAALTLFKLAIVVQDYRLRLNQHYMALVITLAFLLVADKRRLLRWQLVLFYVWAGLLKLGWDWLSGAALHARPLGVPAALVPAACWYVIGLECLLVWGLLSRRAWLFWAVLAQLALFHVASFPVVGFFYPVLMFLLLALLPLDRLRPAAAPAGGLPWPARGFLIGFSLLQLLPRVFPGDTAVTGEGRLFALHMIDARVTCEAAALVHRAGRPDQRVELRGALPTRTRCDPIVYVSVGRWLCERYAREPGFVDLDLSLRSKRASAAALRPVIDRRGVCADPPSYSVWWPNDWIRK